MLVHIAYDSIQEKKKKTTPIFSSPNKKLAISPFGKDWTQSKSQNQSQKL